MAIKDACGEWIFEESAVKEYIRNGFVGIYSTSLVSAPVTYNTNFQW